jgi:hypothetical protein
MGDCKSIIAGFGIAVLMCGEAAALDISAGVNGGLAIASMTGRDAVPEGGWKKVTNCVVNGGAVVDVDILPGLGVELDCIYSTKGIKVRDTAGSREVSRRYTYLDVPVLLKLYLLVDEDSPVRQSFFAGPFFGKLLSAEKTTSGTGGSCAGTVDIKDEVEPWDIGLIVGSGAEVDAGPGRLFIDFRFSKGLVTVGSPGTEKKKCGTTATPAEDIKTLLLGITVGYVFTF